MLQFVKLLSKLSDLIKSIWNRVLELIMHSEVGVNSKMKVGRNFLKSSFQYASIEDFKYEFKPSSQLVVSA